VRDVDDRDAALGQATDHPEQVGDLVVREDGARLVHDHQPCLAGQRASHADDLFGRGRKLPDLPAHRNLRVPQLREDLACPAADLAAPHEADGARLVGEKDVVGDGEAVDQIELLVDRRDAGLHRGLRVRERCGLAQPDDLATVGTVRARQDLDEGGLPGAVLAEQAVHLARGDLELDAVERAHARERLHDVSKSEDRLGHDGCPYAISLASTAAPTTPARGPSSESTTGRFPVASGNERRYTTLRISARRM
jgi:hypothetical protein